ncbi:hypothetical protein B566_EDAN011802 [Ephemera danica]|nr:hypothetical protein B566_EDAN011802 [Ephemera danica]
MATTTVWIKVDRSDLSEYSTADTEPKILGIPPSNIVVDMKALTLYVTNWLGITEIPGLILKLRDQNRTLLPLSMLTAVPTSVTSPLLLEVLKPQAHASSTVPLLYDDYLSALQHFSTALYGRVDRIEREITGFSDRREVTIRQQSQHLSGILHFLCKHLDKCIDSFNNES